MSTTASDFADLFADPGHDLRRALRRIPGLELPEPHRGSLKCGRQKATFLVESGGWIRIELPLGSKRQRQARAALELNGSLAGNVRHAGPSGQLSVVADTRVDGTVHLEESLEEIQDSLRRATGHRVRGNPTKSSTKIDKDDKNHKEIDNNNDSNDRLEGAFDPAAVQERLEALGWGEGSVVQLESGWELRPRIGGAVVPLRVTAERRRLRLHRTVMKSLRDGPSARAVLEQALRFNDEWRLARLSLIDDALVVESGLHQGQMDAEWIRVAARAVATAYRHCLSKLETLDRDTELSRHYGFFFC